MKIDRLKIANGLKDAGQKDANATTITIALCDAIEDALKEMATIKDLEIIAAKSDARSAEATKNVIVWVIGVGFSVVSVMIALKLFT